MALYVRQKMSNSTYRVGFRGALFYFFPLVFIATVGHVGYRWLIHDIGEPPRFILNFIRIPWYAVLAFFAMAALFRLGKRYQVALFSDHALLTEYFLFIRMRSIRVDSRSRFRVEVPVDPAGGGGALSPSILFTEPRRFRIGKGLSIADLTEIVTKLKMGEQVGASDGEGAPN